MKEPSECLYKFGDFRVDPRKRLLLRGREVVPLTAKVFDLLLILVESKGQLITKDDLMQKLWPDTIVEESNLTQNMSVLRRALGERINERNYVMTVTGKGYCFLATVKEIPIEEIAPENHSKESLTLSDASSTGEKPNEGEETNKNLVAADSPLTGQELSTQRIAPADPKSIPLLKSGKLSRSLKLGLIILLAIILLAALTFVLRLIQKPVIHSISPISPHAVIGDQSVVVYGNGFLTGASIEVFFPSGGSATLSGSQILDVTPTSLVMVIDFNGNPGKYKIRVKNPYARSSDPFMFELTSYIQSPTIEAIFPASPVASKDEESVVIYGYNFQFGASVEVTFPNGESVTLNPGRQIPNGTHTALSTLIYFDGKPGSYTIRVKNPTGRWSNKFSFIAQ
jgi:DNA-binding winged helix-turn-helix (wHTH) protein